MYYEAREKALNNGCHYHIAAILRRKKRVVRIGINSYKTHPAYKRTYADGTSAACMHAEMDALRFSEPGDTLEVMRFVPTGYAMAKPCPLCMSLIQQKKISKLRFTNRQGEWEEYDLKTQLMEIP